MVILWPDLRGLIVSATLHDHVNAVVREALAHYRQHDGEVPDTFIASLSNKAWMGGRASFVTNSRDRMMSSVTLGRCNAQVYGSEHPNVATDANNIGGILQDQGDLVEALAYMERALAILKKVSGPKHPDTQTVAANLDSVRKELGVP